MVPNVLELLYEYETLNCPSVTLRKFRKEDADAVLAFGSDPAALEYVDWTGIGTKREAIDSIVAYYWSKPGIYAIEIKETGECAGCIDLRLVPEHEKAGFGCILNRRFWGRGVMTEALSALIELCFDKLELNRVESCHYLGNEGSGRVMQKCGMKLEGVCKQEVKIKGVFRDAAHYAILRSDYMAAR